MRYTRSRRHQTFSMSRRPSIGGLLTGSGFCSAAFNRSSRQHMFCCRFGLDGRDSGIVVCSKRYSPVCPRDLTSLSRPIPSQKPAATATNKAASTWSRGSATKLEHSDPRQGTKTCFCNAALPFFSAPRQVPMARGKSLQRRHARSQGAGLKAKGSDNCLER